MKMPIRLLTLLAAVSLSYPAHALSANAADEHQSHHPQAQAADQAAASPQASSQPSSQPMGTHGDMASMCEMHQKMMHAKSPAERKILMAEHMQAMPPGMREKHMHMMRENMKMMQELMGSETSSK